MSPKRIKLLLVGKPCRLFERLKYDPLMEIVGSCPSWLQYRNEHENGLLAETEVIVLTLPEDSAGCEALLLFPYGKGGAKLVGIASNAASATILKPVLHAWMIDDPADTRIGLEELYARLKYQIKNARLALLVESADFCGKRTTLPAQPSALDTRQFTEIPEACRYDLIAVGASAGGTEAILAVLAKLPGNMPPVLVVQHIPRNFVELFAQHLREKCRMKICLAVGGERLERGVVYITAEDRHLTVCRQDSTYYAECRKGEKTSGHRPSVDELFYSVAVAAGNRAIGVILTGMGADGAKGLLKMRQTGAYTIGQDKESCTVYGMPAAAYELGAVEKQLPLICIGGELISAVTGGEGR